MRYLAAPWDGQKTGAFLDQRPNRLLAGALRGAGRPGARLLRLPRLLRHPPGAARRHASSRSTLSPDALARGAANAALNGLEQHRVARGGRVRDAARLRPGAGAVRHHRPRPPGVRQDRARGRRPRSAATARSTSGRCAAWPRAASCSPPAAPSTSGCPSSSPCWPRPPADSGRRIHLRRILGQGEDHPEVLTIPETSYLKGAVLQAE